MASPAEEVPQEEEEYVEADDHEMQAETQGPAEAGADTAAANDSSSQPQASAKQPSVPDAALAVTPQLKKKKTKKKKAQQSAQPSSSVPATQGTELTTAPRRPPKGKRFKDLRWQGTVIGKVKALLKGESLLAWEKAYNLYTMRSPEGFERKSFPHSFLAAPLYWGSGLLLPGLSQDGGVHIWLYNLYGAMHQCVEYSYNVRTHAGLLLNAVKAATSQLEELCNLKSLPAEAEKHASAVASSLQEVVDGLAFINKGEYFRLYAQSVNVDDST
jgi:hypothetical protein